MPEEHSCCAEKLEGKLDAIRESQIRMEQKAESSWDPAAQQTWRNKSVLNKLTGGLILVGSLLVLVSGVVTLMIGRVI